MGEFEDETVSEQAETAPTTPQPEPAGATPQPPLAEEAAVGVAAVGSEPVGTAPVSEDDAIAAIHAQLSLEVSEAETASDAPATEAGAPEAEPVETADAEAADVESAGEETADAETPIGEPSGEESTPDELPTDESALASTDEPASDDTEVELSDDDLAAAIAASSEAVGTDATLDDIAPGTLHTVAEEEPVVDDVVRYGAPWWPFLIYLGLWIALAGVAIWQFQELAAGIVLYETEQYTMLVFGGLVLAAAGVFLILAVWLGARMNPKRHRAGLFTSAFVKGAAFILIGMVVWWGTLMALDYLRLGRMI